MSFNLWQYVVLLLGLGAVATAVGLAHESLRRDPLRLVGYANVGVALISLSVCANLATNLHNHPTASTWVAAAGFILYALAAVATWLHALRLFTHRPFHHRLERGHSA